MYSITGLRPFTFLVFCSSDREVQYFSHIAIYLSSMLLQSPVQYTHNPHHSTIDPDHMMND